MTPLQTYWLEPAHRLRRSLRRFRYSDREPKCITAWNCDTSVILDELEKQDDEPLVQADAWPHDDARWPKACVACGQPFQPTDEWQLSQDTLYFDSRTSKQVTLHEAEPGATWDATWYHQYPDWCGPDGLSIMAKLPDGHDWHVDGCASNCDRKDDKAHRCWVRHGDPRLCHLTVDKAGNTCGAGGGSIMSPKGWHGFLRDGCFVLA